MENEMRHDNNSTKNFACYKTAKELSKTMLYLKILDSSSYATLASSDGQNRLTNSQRSLQAGAYSVSP